MRHSATSSEPGGLAARARAGALVLAALVSTPGYGSNLISCDEALAQVFPAATPRREAIFLSQSQLAEVATRSGVSDQGPVVTRWVLESAAGVVGYAYLDTHRVRTLPESILVFLEADGRVRQVEVVAFREPPEYMPRQAWYDQYRGSQLSPELALKRSIRPVTGATLTARATTAAVRRMLAVHAVVEASP